jgi:hypothetical protein
MKFYVEQLDKRHNGHMYWQYRLRLQTSTDLEKSHHRNFHLLRCWMQEQYGDSCERDLYGNIALACKGYESFNPPWCWHVDRENQNTLYIYIKNREVLSNITLKWI